MVAGPDRHPTHATASGQRGRAGGHGIGDPQSPLGQFAAFPGLGQVSFQTHPHRCQIAGQQSRTRGRHRSGCTAAGNRIAGCCIARLPGQPLPGHIQNAFVHLATSVRGAAAVGQIKSARHTIGRQLGGLLTIPGPQAALSIGHAGGRIQIPQQPPPAGIENINTAPAPGHQRSDFQRAQLAAPHPVGFALDIGRGPFGPVVVPGHGHLCARQAVQHRHRQRRIRQAGHIRPVFEVVPLLPAERQLSGPDLPPETGPPTGAGQAHRPGAFFGKLAVDPGNLPRQLFGGQSPRLGLHAAVGQAQNRCPGIGQAQAVSAAKNLQPDAQQFFQFRALPTGG